MKPGLALLAILIAFLSAAPAEAQAVRIAAYELKIDPAGPFVWDLRRRLHSEDARAALIAVTRRLSAPRREIGEIATTPERHPAGPGHRVIYRVDPGHVLCAAFVAPTSSFATLDRCGFAADDRGVASVATTSPGAAHGGGCRVRLDMISVRGDLADVCVALPAPDEVFGVIGPRAQRLYPPPDPSGG